MGNSKAQGLAPLGFFIAIGRFNLLVPIMQAENVFEI
jgi:hypothetical protein